MTDPLTIFPVYRCYSNHKHWFRIRSETQFDEITITGDKHTLSTFTARTYPDRVLIQDLIHNTHHNCLEVSEASFNELMSKIKN
ncbi:MAG: hypothetical protein KDD36_05515 [Flavobacteriales bacterium]|nr:hypothetical protein [Flavobacteriales bacterium]